MVNKPPKMPDSSVDSRLLGNLRRARLDFVEVDRQMDELLEQQRLQRIEKRKQKAIDSQSVN